MDVVEAMHPVRNPADIVLRRDNFELRKALENAAVDEPRDALFDDMNDVNLQIRRGRHRRCQGHTRDQWLVQRDRLSGLRCDPPERVKTLVAVWKIIGVGGKDQYAFEAALGAALDFGNVGQRSERIKPDADQPVRTMLAEFREPIVVDPQASHLQVGVFHAEQDNAETGVENLRDDAIKVLILETFDRIPSARTRGFIAMLHMLAQFVAAAAGGEDTGDRQRMDSRADENIRRAARLLILDHARRIVAELAVDALDPKIAGFRHVRISRNYS